MTLDETEIIDKAIGRWTGDDFRGALNARLGRYPCDDVRAVYCDSAGAEFVMRDSPMFGTVAEQAAAAWGAKLTIYVRIEGRRALFTAMIAPAMAADEAACLNYFAVKAVKRIGALVERSGAP